jgi:hypothetical protein
MTRHKTQHPIYKQKSITVIHTFTGVLIQDYTTMIYKFIILIEKLIYSVYNDSIF